MGPTTKAITVSRRRSRFAQLIEAYYEQADGLIEGGADMLLVETCNDTRNVKAALLAIDRLRREIGRSHPDHGLGNDRTERHHARRTDRRRVLSPRSPMPTCFPSG